jgi:hypothetical protein
MKVYRPYNAGNSYVRRGAGLRGRSYQSIDLPGGGAYYFNGDGDYRKLNRGSLIINEGQEWSKMPRCLMLDVGGEWL